MLDETNIRLVGRSVTKLSSLTIILIWLLTSVSKAYNIVIPKQYKELCDLIKQFIDEWTQSICHLCQQKQNPRYTVITWVFYRPLRSQNSSGRHRALIQTTICESFGEYRPLVYQFVFPWTHNFRINFIENISLWKYNIVLRILW